LTFLRTAPSWFRILGPSVTWYTVRNSAVLLAARRLLHWSSMGRHSDTHLAPVTVALDTLHEWQAVRLLAYFESRFRHCHTDGRPRRDPAFPARVVLEGWDPAYLSDLARVEIGETQVSVSTLGHGTGDRRMVVVSLSQDYSKAQLRALCARLNVRAPSVPMRGVELVNEWLDPEHREQVAVVS